MQKPWKTALKRKIQNLEVENAVKNHNSKREYSSFAWTGGEFVWKNVGRVMHDTELVTN